MKDITFFIYTNSKYAFLWKMFFSQLEELVGEEVKKIVLSDSFPKTIENSDCITYSDEDTVSEHIIKGLEKVETKYIFWFQEDNIPYQYVNKEKLLNCLEFLENTNHDYVKIRKEGTKDLWSVNEKRKSQWGYFSKKSKIINIRDNFFEINNDDPMLYSHQLTIWKKNSFEKVHRHMISIKDKYKDVETIKSNNKRKSLLLNKEGFINNECKDNNLIIGSYYFESNSPYYNNNNKCYQSSIAPYINFMLRGKINFRDHRKQIDDLIRKYRVDKKEYIRYL